MLRDKYTATLHVPQANAFQVFPLFSKKGEKPAKILAFCFKSKETAKILKIFQIETTVHISKRLKNTR